MIFTENFETILYPIDFFRNNWMSLVCGAFVLVMMFRKMSKLYNEEAKFEKLIYGCKCLLYGIVSVLSFVEIINGGGVIAYFILLASLFESFDNFVRFKKFGREYSRKIKRK